MPNKDVWHLIVKARNLFRQEDDIIASILKQFSDEEFDLKTGRDEEVFSEMLCDYLLRGIREKELKRFIFKEIIGEDEPAEDADTVDGVKNFEEGSEERPAPVSDGVPITEETDGETIEYDEDFRDAEVPDINDEIPDAETIDFDSAFDDTDSDEKAADESVTTTPEESYEFEISEEDDEEQKEEGESNDSSSEEPPADNGEKHSSIPSLSEAMAIAIESYREKTIEEQFNENFVVPDSMGMPGFNVDEEEEDNRQKPEIKSSGENKKPPFKKNKYRNYKNFNKYYKKKENEDGGKKE